MEDHPNYDLFGDEEPIMVGENNPEKYLDMDADPIQTSAMQEMTLSQSDYDKVIPPYLQALSHIREALKILKEQSPSRALSITITNLETARLWLAEAEEEDDENKTT